jgi:hypothetical protein
MKKDVVVDVDLDDLDSPSPHEVFLTEEEITLTTLINICWRDYLVVGVNLALVGIVYFSARTFQRELPPNFQMASYEFRDETVSTGMLMFASFFIPLSIFG